jgi:hypothetical protein
MGGFKFFFGFSGIPDAPDDFVSYILSVRVTQDNKRF